MGGGTSGRHANQSWSAGYDFRARFNYKPHGRVTTDTGDGGRSDPTAGGVGRGNHAVRRHLVTAGMARMLALLRSATIVHPSLRRRQGQLRALITLADRFVTAAAALER